MATRHFRRAKLFKTVVQLEFDTEGSHPLSITIPLESAHLLAGWLISALRAAEQHGTQFPPLQGEDNLTMSINDLPVTRYQVADSVDEPDRVFLLLQTSEGLSLSYSFERPLAQEVGTALVDA
jgi:hypothetical protein